MSRNIIFVLMYHCHKLLDLKPKKKMRNAGYAIGMREVTYMYKNVSRKTAAHSS
jgi:hypothetical protein